METRDFFEFMKLPLRVEMPPQAYIEAHGLPVLIEVVCDSCHRAVSGPDASVRIPDRCQHCLSTARRYSLRPYSKGPAHMDENGNVCRCREKR